MLLQYLDFHWKTKGITDINFNEKKRVVSFKTSEFGVFSLSQDGHLNMPFQSWELRPKNVDSSVLNIIGAIVEAEIEIKVCLTGRYKLYFFFFF